MSSKIIKTTILTRNGTSTDWNNNNPVLGLGEIGIDTTSHNFKVGDGTTKWNSLPYYITKTTATTTADGLMSKGDKTKLDGIAENATRVIESTVSGWGFTKNTGTVTGVKINGTTKNPTSGIVDLGTVLTSHQSIKVLNTSNTTAQTAAESESINGNGVINLHKISKTGNYNDLLNKPTIPTVNNGKLTISIGTTDHTFTANQSTNTDISLAPVAASGSYNDLLNTPTIPTKVSDLSDASNYATTTQLGNYLPLSGGTLTGTLNSKTINVKGANATITIENVSTNIDYAKIETPATRALHLQAPNDTYLVIGDKTYSTDRTNKYKLIVNGTSKINGLMTMSGNLIPSTTNTYNLGDATHTWKDFWATNITGDSITVKETGTLFVGQNEITATNPAASFELKLPNQSGTFALQSEISNVVVTDLTSI